MFYLSTTTMEYLWLLVIRQNNCFNEKLGEITFQNKPSEFGKLITKCKKYCTDGKGIVFALENSYGYGRALVAWLIERNYIVKDVNPVLSYAYRKSVSQYKVSKADFKE